MLTISQPLPPLPDRLDQQAHFFFSYDDVFDVELAAETCFDNLILSWVLALTVDKESVRICILVSYVRSKIFDRAPVTPSPVSVLVSK